MCTYPPETYGLDFTIKEYKALKPIEWISEQIIDFYLGYVRKRQNIDKEIVMLFNTSLWHILDSQKTAIDKTEHCRQFSVDKGCKFVEGGGTRNFSSTRVSSWSLGCCSGLA